MNPGKQLWFVFSLELDILRAAACMVNTLHVNIKNTHKKETVS